MIAWKNKLLFASTALALTACGGGSTTFVRMPASELAAVGPSTLRDGPPPPTVKTIDGSSHQIAGPISQVEIDMTDKKIVPVALPFKARIMGDQLEVLTDQVRTYPVQNISFVQLQYGGTTASEDRRNVKSGALIVSGLIPLGVGVALIVEDSSHSSIFSGFGTVAGGVLALGGAGLLIAGIAVGSSDPRPTPKTTKIQPKLRLSPTGGTFSFDF